MDLTEEQRAFVSAIETFCGRECGTREQRDALTGRGAESHNDALYRKMADLGWLGVHVDPEYGGAGGSMVDLMLFLEHTARGMAPIGGFATTMIAAAAYARFGTPQQKATILGGVVNGAVGVDRHVRAGGRIRCREPAVPGTSGGRRLRHQRAEDLVLQRPHRRPHPAGRPDRGGSAATRA